MLALDILAEAPSRRPVAAGASAGVAAAGAAVAVAVAVGNATALFNPKPYLAINR